MANEVEFDERIYDILLKTFEEELKEGLKGYYVWKLNENVWNDEKVKLNVRDGFIGKMKDKTIPEQTIYLKKELKKELCIKEKDEHVFLNFAHWVIQKWGGIPRSPGEEKLKSLYKKLKDEKSKNIIENVDNISSLSKVAAFYDDSKYAVYDSRVIFTLNWLIFINGLHEQDNPKRKMKFFRQPDGRNTDIKKHNQDTIFGLVYKTFDINNTYYYSEKESYKVYCELLENAVRYYERHKCDYLIKKDRITIGELEMCLFSIAAEDKRLSKNKIKCNYGIHNGDNDGYITDQMDRVLREPIVKAVKKERERLKSK